MHSILDFTDIPEQLKKMVGDYHINLLDIKKLQDTSVYKTDLKQVFDFIRFSSDKEKLWELVENDNSYKQMDEDAYDVAISFTKSEKLIDKERYTEGGKVNMCRALVEIKEEGIQLGIEQKNRRIVTNMLKRNMSDEDICALAECNGEFIDKVRKEMNIEKSS